MELNTTVGRKFKPWDAYQCKYNQLQNYLKLAKSAQLADVKVALDIPTATPNLPAKYVFFFL